MNSTSKIIAVLFLGAAAGGAYYFWKTVSQDGDGAPPLPVAQVTPAVQVSPSASPTAVADHYPVPEESATSEASHIPLKPVPALDASDQTIAEALSDLLGADRFKSVFHLEDIVRRIVVTVDTASSHKQTSEEFLPLKQPEGEFVVTGKKNQKDATISNDNFRRYLPYVELARAVDPSDLVRVYFHFYPLFQAAYRDLGTQGYFNDRLIQVIDHLLETPDVDGPIRVSRPSIRYKYKFSDDRLENLSGAQKVLIRMGHENAQIVKMKLKKIRALLIKKE